MNQYAVVLLFPEEISRQIDALRQDYLRNVHYSIQPHLTLVYPFTPEAGIDRIKTRLKQAAESARAFDLVLDGIKYFESGNNLAYVAITHKQPVVELHYALNKAIQGLIKADWPFSFSNFVPHVSIGDQIPDIVFLKIKEQFSKLNIHYECRITSFTLSAEGEGVVWKSEEVFSLPDST